MKKIISSFGSAVLSREQMRGINGGVNDGDVASTCSHKCPDGTWVDITSDDKCSKCETYDHGAKCTSPSIDRKCSVA